MPDAASRAETLAQLDRWLAELRGIDPGTLSPAVRADRAMLETEFLADRWSLTDLRAWQWNPSVYNVAEPFALLRDLTFAPLDERLRIFSRRLERVPAYYAAAKANIESPTREHTQLAIDQNRGALAVFGPDLEQTLEMSGLSAARARGVQRAPGRGEGGNRGLRSLARSARRAARGGRRRGALVPLGTRALRAEVRLRDPIRRHGRGALRARARREGRAARAHGHAGRAAVAEILPERSARPATRSRRSAGVIARLSDDHVAPAELVREVERQIPELTQWVREHDLLELDASKPLIVRETPPHKRGIAGAGIDAPGPYDASAPTYYNVTPLDGERAERAESWLREYNRWMLPVLNIHEAIPGHYVQLVYANRSPSLIKSIFGNGAMIEGWAVYAERVMLESGYGEHRAEAWLVYSKWNLRSVCNTILDYGVHVLGMTEAEAMDLLTRQAFQTEAEAVEKWRRVQLTNVQLTSYFSGYAAILDLRETLKRERAGHVRPEALPRAVLELRQRARARHSRADARGVTASERDACPARPDVRDRPRRTAARAGRTPGGRSSRSRCRAARCLCRM